MLRSNAIDSFVFPPVRPWFVLVLAHVATWVWTVDVLVGAVKR